jgi:hypothetical protein
MHRILNKLILQINGLYIYKIIGIKSTTNLNMYIFQADL